MTTAECSVLDLSGRREGARREGRKNRDLSDAIARACAANGYFAIKNHGIPASVLEAARAAALLFFGRAMPEKMEVCASEMFAGYVPPRLDSEAGMTPLPKELPKEAFNVVEHEMAEVWPRCPGALETALTACWDAMSELATDLLTRLASVTDGTLADEGFLQGQLASTLSLFRSVLYPSTSALEREDLERCEPHTDLGSLTILDSDFCSDALQVQTANGQWKDLQLANDVLLVNVGDELEKWSNGAWRAPLHRVATAYQGQTATRLSLIFFHNPASIRSVVQQYLQSSSRSLHGGNR